jgi:hypothetical protein
VIEKGSNYFVIGFAIEWDESITRYQKQPRKDVSPVDRVTRMGEFSPNRWVFLLGSLIKNAEEAHIFGYFFHF